MRRLIASLTIVIIGLWAAGAPAWAITETQELNYKVSGPYGGTLHYDLSTPRCSFVHTVFDITVRPAPDNPAQPAKLGTIHIDTCVIGSYTFDDGTFVFTSSRGATLYGNATGNFTFPEGNSGPIDVTLTVRGGTSSFNGVTGRIRLSGTISVDVFSTSGSDGQTSGTSTGALVRPK